ncbi:peroxiredoxin-like family protein [Roseixanthobacter liquoris]|uniref:peroxiredoxin-like family protein n=1 Tax=Roseixanthobacter liquoris TaxID=3119921 RepID=UPI003727BE26
MSLVQDLAARRAAFEREAPRDRVSLYEGAIEDLRRSGLLDVALSAGQAAPDFILPDAQGEDVRFAEILAKGPVVLTFYRGGWCPYCNLQLRAYQQALPRIRDLGGALLAISPQLPDRSRETVATGGLAFPVLSDVGNAVAATYGLVCELPPQLREAYARNGIELPQINGEARWRLPVPGTFVVAPDGRVLMSYVDADYRNRLDPEEILNVLADLKDEQAPDPRPGPSQGEGA